jgi:lipopolysaccharide transport system ATP-binding protein
MTMNSIEAHELSKKYRLGGRERYIALRDVLARAVTAPARILRSATAREKKERPTFWALKDVSFDIPEGQIVGVIGRNGAGKTTLLKILTRITRPTSGYADIRGRVGSLLEVGTGFHPELTGRENVYFNGGILGMTRREIDSKFDEIIEFAETGRFVDTVVKRYSSGMQVRLAFAVAAHLDPEILLVDEVLSVGDLKFQRKCIEKMADVAQSGRTILFVSHQMNQIRRLCERVIWLDGGIIVRDGRASEVVSEYESAANVLDSAQDGPRVVADRTQFMGWWLTEGERERGHELNSSWEPLRVTFLLNLAKALESGHFGIGLYDSSGALVWGTGEEDLQLARGQHELSFNLPLLPLKPAHYRWKVSIWEYGKMLDLWDAIPELLVATDPVTHWIDQFAGVLNVPGGFESTQVDNVDG